MGLVNIEESELATLRQERNDARTAADEKANEARELTTKLEKAEADLTAEKDRADKEEKARKDFEEKAQRATLKESRISALGDGFLGKLGEFTRERLNEQASTLSDEEWDAALKEREEMANAKRDAKAESSSGSGEGEGSASGSGSEQATAGSAFSSEEVARFSRQGVTTPAPAPSGSGGAARQLARAFQPKRPAPSTAGK